MRRTALLAVLSFLLLSMQHEAQVHALSHLGPQLARSQDTAFVAPHADVACVECALLANGNRPRSATAIRDRRPRDRRRNSSLRRSLARHRLPRLLLESRPTRLL